HHRVVTVVVTADGEIVVRVRGEGDELIALGRLDVAHRLEAHRGDDLVAAAGDGFPGLLQAESACGASPFDAHMRLWTKPDEILHHRASLELKSEVVGEIGDDAAFDVGYSQLAAEIGES